MQKTPYEVEDFSYNCKLFKSFEQYIISMQSYGFTYVTPYEKI